MAQFFGVLQFLEITPAELGPRAIVKARVNRLGRSTVFTNASILSENGEVLARAVHTATLRPID